MLCCLYTTVYINNVRNWQVKQHLEYFLTAIFKSVGRMSSPYLDKNIRKHMASWLYRAIYGYTQLHYMVTQGHTGLYMTIQGYIYNYTGLYMAMHGYTIKPYMYTISIYTIKIRLKTKTISSYWLYLHLLYVFTADVIFP